MGARVVCSVASFWARVWPEPALPLAPRSRKSVARKKVSGEERGPWAWERGERVGTVVDRAFRDACSPRNISSAWGPVPVFMK